MKKVYEHSVSETVTETYDDFDGLVDHVIDPFDGEEPINLLDNAVKLEKGQEAIFKVTVTTTVELIDVRMAEVWSKAEVAEVDAKAKELEPLFHADGRGFFYGNPGECGWKPPVVKLVICPHGYKKDQPGTCNCWPKADGWFQLAPEHFAAAICYPIPIPSTQTQPKLIHFGWGPTKCGRSNHDLIHKTNDTWTTDRSRVTCPDCLKTLQDEPPRYEWWCSVCGRTEAPPGLHEKFVGLIGKCFTCTNGLRRPERSTMVVREKPRPT